MSSRLTPAPRWLVVALAIAIATALRVGEVRAQSQPAQPAPPPPTTVVRTVVARAVDGSTILVADTNGANRTSWTASRPDVRLALASVDRGDLVSASVALTGSGWVVQQLAPVQRTVSRGDRLLALFASAAALLLLARIFVPGGVRRLVVGEDNRYSNSKTQAALWFLTVLTAYLASVALRIAYGGLSFVGGVGIPSNLLWLSGISAMTFAGAKQIVVSRIEAAGPLPVDRPADRATIATRAARRVKPPSPWGPRVRDLVTDDSGVRGDFGDFQMLVITLVAVVVYTLAVYGWLARLPLQTSVTLPDIDSTLLGIFGVGQGAYLAKKYVGDTGISAAPGPPLSSRPPRPDSVSTPSPTRHLLEP